jgi:cytochrome oxidase assembly protein ShyY1
MIALQSNHVLGLVIIFLAFVLYFRAWQLERQCDKKHVRPTIDRPVVKDDTSN